MESLGCVVMLLKSSLNGKWWGSEDKAQIISGTNCQNCKIPWIPLLRCQSCKVPANSTALSLVLEKFSSGVSSLQVLCRWRFVVSSCFDERYSFLLFCRDVFTVKFSSWKRISCWLIFLCFRDDRTSFVCPPHHQKNFSVSYEKKIRYIHQNGLFLKNDKLMTFNKVRANTLLPQINSRWRKKSWSSNTINTWSN